MQARARNWPPQGPLTFKPPNEERLTSIEEFVVDDGDTIIAVFQGNRGQSPPLDIIVKYRQRGKQLRTPQHVHWAIDLLIKKQHVENLTTEFVEFLIDLYDRLEPFESQEDRAQRLAHRVGVETNQALEQFRQLDEFGEYSVRFTGYILELMSIAEKTGNPAAFMFRKVLSTIREGQDIFRIVSTANFRGR